VNLLNMLSRTPFHLFSSSSNQGRVRMGDKPLGIPSVISVEVR